MTINQRIKFLIEKLELNKNSFSERIGVLPQTIHNIVDGRQNEPSFKVIQKILSTFVDVNPSWLILGNGSYFTMENLLKEPSESYAKSTPKSTPNSTPNLKIDSLSAITPVIVTVDDAGNENIVLVDVKAAAGYISSRLEPTFIKELPAFKLPGGGYRNSTYRAFEIENDSMYDTIYPGDWAISRLLTGHVLDIRDGYVHVIVTQTDIIIKRCVNRSKERGKIVCMSDNEAYPPFELSIEDIKEVWFVHKIITGHLPARNKDLKRLVSRLESDMVEMRNRQDVLERKFNQNRL